MAKTAIATAALALLILTPAPGHTACNCCKAGPGFLAFESAPAGGACGTVSNFRCRASIGGDPDFASHACLSLEDCALGPCVMGPNVCTGDPAISCTGDPECQGTCDEVTGGGLPADLQCRGLYTGGGGNTGPLPLQVPDQTRAVARTAGCVDDILTLAPARASDTGSAFTCTEGRKCSAGSASPDAACADDGDCPGGACEDRCFLGPPLPLPNASTPPVSLCVVRTVAGDVSGSVDCAEGSTDLSLPLAWSVHLEGDVLRAASPPDVPGIQPCPLCSRVCMGGDRAGFPCTDDSPDCDAGGTCSAGAECLGGPNDGLGCTPATSILDVHACCQGSSINSGARCTDDSECFDGTCVNGCASFPTSPDCPPSPSTDIAAAIGGLPIDFRLTTGSAVVTATDHASGPRTFCGFCRDVQGEGSLCFDGDPASCPDSAAQPTCLPASAMTAGCGRAIPCETDADCTAPYESCVQRSSGALGYLDATRISAAGSTDGQCLADFQPHAAQAVSLYCIPPTFDPSVDAAGDLPGPAAELLSLDITLSPGGQLSGKKLLIRNALPEDPARRKAVWITKDPDIITGDRGTPDDPRCIPAGGGGAGGAIRFRSDGSGGSSQDTGEIPLPCEKWTALGSEDNPRGYRYKDRELEDGPCKTVIVKDGRLAKASCNGRGAASFDYDLMPGIDEGTIDVTFIVGALKYCSAHQGSAGKDGSDGKKFFSRDSPAPEAQCP